MKGIRQIKLNSFEDDRGVLCVMELKDYVEWRPERIYYVTNVVKDRGGHAVRGEKKVYICMKGKCIARFHDGNKWTEFQMHGPNDAIIVENMVYREFVDFSDDAVLMAASSINYEPDSYIYDLDEYIKEIKS